jgi:site-specific recombinase XerD
MQNGLTIYNGEIPDHLAFDEVRRIIDACQQVPSFIKYKTSLRNRLFLETLWQTGCRLGEALGGVRTSKGVEVGLYQGVRGMDLDIPKGTITVQVEKQKKITSHIIAVETSLVAELVDFYTSQGIKREDRIFQLNKRQAEYVIKIAALHADITRKVNPHILRHSNAVYMRSQGVHPFVMQKALGHTNMGSTLVYSRASDEDVAQAKALIKWR